VFDFAHHVTTDLKQERLCKKTTLWAKGDKKKELAFWAKTKEVFFSRKYRSLQSNKHFVKKQRPAKQKDGQSQRWGKVKKNSKSLLTLGEVGKM
jgi:hypothetical protein